MLPGTRTWSRKLPYARRVDYLKFTGAQVINPAINLYGATSFTADITFMQPTPTSSDYQGRVFSSEGGGTNYRDLYVSALNNKCYFRPGGSNFLFNDYYDAKIRYVYDGTANRFYADGELFLTANNAFAAQATSYPLLIGRRANNFTSAFLFNGRLYSVSFELNGAPHLVGYPVIDNDGVACLYNAVTNTCLYSATSTPLQCGSDVSAISGGGD